MKLKLLLAAFILGTAIAGSTVANAGTRQSYASVNNKRPTAVGPVTKDNNTNGSYVTYRSGVGLNANVSSRIFKIDRSGKHEAYTPSVKMSKGTRYLMKSYDTVAPLKKSDQIQLVIGTAESADTVFYTWEYN